MNIIIANIIDFGGALIQLGSGSIRKKSQFLVIQTIQLLLQAVSMFLLGGITGAISNIISCLRNFVCYKGRLNAVWKAVFIAVYVVITVFFNNQGIVGLIPVFACTTFILFMGIKDPIGFKVFITVSFIPWLIYHFILMSYVGAIFDVLTIAINVATLVIMIRDKKKKAAKMQNAES